MSFSAGSLTVRPFMDLTFEVLKAREILMRVPTSIDTVKSWTIYKRHIKCDIMPVNDTVYFTQTGTTNIATHTLHFRANEDILPHDRVQFLSSRRLAGPVGSWYEVMEVLQPTETMAYIRAHCKITDAPISSHTAMAVREYPPIMHDTPIFSVSGP